jgi:hypothetical protein
MSEETGRTPDEERFLGVRTTIEPPEPEQEQAEEAWDVEIVDDRPEADKRFPDPLDEKTKQAREKAAQEDEEEGELESYGNKVQKRINKLKGQWHDERRAKEALERMNTEAIGYGQALQTENQRLLRLVQDSQSALTQQAQSRAQIALAKAEENFKRAHEVGEAELIAEAQKDLTQAQLAQNWAPRISEDIVENWKRQVQAEERQMAQAQPQQQYVQEEYQPDEKAVSWQQDNQWFGQDAELTSFAYGVHNRLVNDEGVDPTSDEYYQLIDQRMKEVFPAQFSGDNVVVETAQRRKATPVVAPASRNSGATPRKVTLTATQVRLANRLGLTAQQYAAQVMKERN